MLKYGDKDKAMTCTIGEYLKRNYSSKNSSWHLSLRKLICFLKHDLF